MNLKEEQTIRLPKIAKEEEVKINLSSHQEIVETPNNEDRENSDPNNNFDMTIIALKEGRIKNADVSIRVNEIEEREEEEKKLEI